jgi:prophage regulatory protein
MSLPGNPADDDFFLRLGEVKSRSGLSKSTIYKLIRTGEFPAPRKLGGSAVGWRASDFAKWRDSRPLSCESQAA